MEVLIDSVSNLKCASFTQSRGLKGFPHNKTTLFFCNLEPIKHRGEENEELLHKMRDFIKLCCSNSLENIRQIAIRQQTCIKGHKNRFLFINSYIHYVFNVYISWKETSLSTENSKYGLYLLSSAILNLNTDFNIV